jgi:hypothetical protein
MIGVCPSGAQVRRRVGMSRTPRSSRNASWAPRRRTCVSGWPLVALPGGHRLFGAREGPAFRHLTTPPPAPQHRPHVRGVLAYSERQPDHRGHALQGPSRGREAIGAGPLPRQSRQGLALLRCRLARPTGHRLGSQGCLVPLCPRLLPVVHCSHRRLYPACNLAQAPSLLHERDGPAAPLFQCLGGTLGSHVP